MRVPGWRLDSVWHESGIKVSRWFLEYNRSLARKCLEVFFKSGQVKLEQVKSGQVKSEHAKSGQVKLRQVNKLGQVKSGHVKSRQVKF